MAPTRNQAAGTRGAKTRRDLALLRVSKVTRRIAVATVAAVGILGLYVSRSLPGHATTPASQTTGTTTTPTTSAPASGSSGSSTSQTAPAPPVTPPTTTPQRVHVTTGAS
jgi:hypothetical protein